MTSKANYATFGQHQPDARHQDVSPYQQALSQAMAGQFCYAKRGQQ